MHDKGLGIQSIVEPMLIIFSILAFAASKLYPNMQLFVSNQYLAPIALDLALGVSLIFTGSAIIEAYGKAAGNEREVHDTAQIFKLIAYPILALIILKTLNISIGSLLVGAGFLGIVVGLAAQTSFGNVFSGLSLMYSRPFKVGDKITFIPMFTGMQAPSYHHDLMLTSITGTVKRIGLIYTRILSDDLSLIYIPNSALNQGYVENHSRVDEKLIKVRLEVQRNTNIDRFKERFLERLSDIKQDFEKLRDLEIRISLMSTVQDVGIIISARVMVLEWDRLSQWISETALKALSDANSMSQQPAPRKVKKKG